MQDIMGHQMAGHEAINIHSRRQASERRAILEPHWAGWREETRIASKLFRENASVLSGYAPDEEIDG